MESPLSVTIAHFVPIRYQTWPPQTILVSDWLISKKSSPLKPLGQMNRDLLGCIYGRSSFRPDPLTNMAAIAVPEMDGRPVAKCD
jgi:hypothetical protein